jgi:hypothetical protein
MGKGMNILQQFILRLKENNELTQSFDSIEFNNLNKKISAIILNFDVDSKWELKEMFVKSTAHIIPERDFANQLTLILNISDIIPYDFTINIPIYQDTSQQIWGSIQMYGIPEYEISLNIKPREGYFVRIIFKTEKMPKTWNKIRENFLKLVVEGPILF